VILTLDLWSISLLLAVLSIALLFTSEMLSSRYSTVNIPINRRKLRKIAIITAILFLITVTLKAVSIITR